MLFFFTENDENMSIFRTSLFVTKFQQQFLTSLLIPS